MHKINYTDDIDLSKISRRGSFDKSKLPSEAVRNYCVSVRLNIEELQLLNIKRGSYKRRVASNGFLQRLPPAIPAINTKAWKALTEISQKLNRIAAHIDGKSKDSHLTHTELFAVKRQLEELRTNLLSDSIWSLPNEGYAKNSQG